jgi:hypothetical protein
MHIPHSLLMLLSLDFSGGDSPSGGEPATSPRLESLLRCLDMAFSSADGRRSCPPPNGSLNLSAVSEASFGIVLSARSRSVPLW